ncbi:hypothetical protein [Hydrogenibacillus sp. N12]|uniref:hypothetical protein n=1 Tax=Hydrogenibacillus sp. N12 TaxID=2866627 RepID=UPI001C7E02A4|nr:hypothetical protein [Hydrogenibacillus sp. N12]QZA34031.1 hypothetical protein K2M58_05935 [Hydrogenibacillus sp. N12]
MIEKPGKLRLSRFLIRFAALTHVPSRPARRERQTLSATKPVGRCGASENAGTKRATWPDPFFYGTDRFGDDKQYSFILVITNIFVIFFYEHLNLINQIEKERHFPVSDGIVHIFNNHMTVCCKEVTPILNGIAYRLYFKMGSFPSNNSSRRSIKSAIVKQNNYFFISTWSFLL